MVQLTFTLSSGSRPSLELTVIHTMLWMVSQKLYAQGSANTRVHSDESIQGRPSFSYGALGCLEPHSPLKKPTLPATPKARGPKERSARRV